MKYYMVMCKRGHCGAGRYQEITFAVMATNLIEAQEQAKKMPAVKHSKGILLGREITRAEYLERRKQSAYHFYR